MGTYASSINAKSGDVVAVTVVMNNTEQKSVTIYYFKDEATAKACYDANRADDYDYYRIDNKIFAGDRMFNTQQ